MLRFFHTIGLAAVDYEIVDSAVRKKPSKARGTYKVYSDKDRFSIGKNASIYRTAFYSPKIEKDLSAYKWKHESWNQMKDEIRKK